MENSHLERHSMTRRSNQVSLPRDTSTKASDADDKKRNLQMETETKPRSATKLSFLMSTDGQGNIQRVIHHDLLLRAPNVVKEVCHDLYRLFPNKAVITLHTTRYKSKSCGEKSWAHL